MARKYELDREHPCLACGAPWRIEMESIEVAESAGPVGWARSKTPGECSKRCRFRDVDAYNEGLEERRRRGWSTP